MELSVHLRGQYTTRPSCFSFLFWNQLCQEYIGISRSFTSGKLRTHSHRQEGCQMRRLLSLCAKYRVHNEDKSPVQTGLTEYMGTSKMKATGLSSEGQQSSVVQKDASVFIHLHTTMLCVAVHRAMCDTPLFQCFPSLCGTYTVIKQDHCEIQHFRHDLQANMLWNF